MRTLLLVLAMAGTAQAVTVYDLQDIHIRYSTNAGSTLTISTGDPGASISFALPGFVDPEPASSHAAFTASLMDGNLDNITFAIGAFSVTRPESYFWQSFLNNDGTVYSVGGVEPELAEINNGIDWGRTIIDHYRFTAAHFSGLSLWPPLPADQSEFGFRIAAALPEPSALALALCGLCFGWRRHR